MKKYDNIIQGTEEWFEKKKGVISGTRLKAIMGTPKAKQDVIYEIIAERLMVGNEDFMEYENPMERGTRLEPEAIKIFEFETNLKVDTTGFVEHDDHQFIGYSPDGLIANTDDSEDIEIKCPLGKNYVKMWLTNKVPEEYFWQIVQAFVTNPKLMKRYFVGYHPRIPRHSIHIIEVNRADLMKDIDIAYKSEIDVLKMVDEKLSELIEI